MKQPVIQDGSDNHTGRGAGFTQDELDTLTDWMAEVITKQRVNESVGWIGNCTEPGEENAKTE